MTLCESRLRLPVSISLAISSGEVPRNVAGLVESSDERCLAVVVGVFVLVRLAAWAIRWQVSHNALDQPSGISIEKVCATIDPAI